MAVRQTLGNVHSSCTIGAPDGRPAAFSTLCLHFCLRRWTLIFSADASWPTGQWMFLSCLRVPSPLRFGSFRFLFPRAAASPTTISERCRRPRQQSRVRGGGPALALHAGAGRPGCDAGQRRQPPALQLGSGTVWEGAPRAHLLPGGRLAAQYSMVLAACGAGGGESQVAAPIPAMRGHRCLH